MAGRRPKVGDEITGETFGGRAVRGRVKKLGRGDTYLEIEGESEMITWASARVVSAPAAKPDVKRWAEGEQRPYDVEGVLAGRYGKMDETRTHAIYKGASMTVCGRIKAEALAGDARKADPTCPGCRAKLKL